MPEPIAPDTHPIGPVHALLQAVPEEEHPRRAALELLAPAWAALDRAEDALLALPGDQEPGMRYFISLADQCFQAAARVGEAARAIAAGEPKRTVDEHLQQATDVAYVAALALPRLPAAVHPALGAVCTAFAVEHEPDLYTRVLDLLTPGAEAAPCGEDRLTPHGVAVAALALRYDVAVREIRRARNRVAASLVPLTRLAAVCLASTRAPHEVAGGMRRDVARFVADLGEEARVFLADLAAFQAGSPEHHARPDGPGDWMARLRDAVTILSELARAPCEATPGEARDTAGAAAGVQGAASLRWIGWVRSDVDGLADTLRAHERTVRLWHRRMDTAADLDPAVPASGVDGYGNQPGEREPPREVSGGRRNEN